MTEVINLTPHALNVLLADDSIRNIAPSGTVARVSTNTEALAPVDGIPAVRSTFGEVVDLPEAEDGKAYVVSRMVLSACPDRTDLFAPGELVRDEEGKVVGCRGLSC